MNPCWAPKLVPITFCYLFGAWAPIRTSLETASTVKGEWRPRPGQKADIGDSFAQFSKHDFGELGQFAIVCPTVPFLVSYPHFWPINSHSDGWNQYVGCSIPPSMATAWSTGPRPRAMFSQTVAVKSRGSWGTTSEDEIGWIGLMNLCYPLVN